MKRIFFLLLATALFVACGGGEEQASAETAAAPEAVVDDITTNPDYQKGLALIAQSDCLTCHKVNEASTGPAYQAVAAKYANAADSTIDRLAGTIIKGGAGNWGSVPMTPHPTISLEDARQMVKYVLLLK